LSTLSIKYLKKNFDEIAILACLSDLAFKSNYEITEDNQMILSALKRSSEEFSNSSIDEISEKLSDYNSNQIEGLVSNIKGITHEMEFVKLENEDGDSIYANMYQDTNHPGFDVELFDKDTGEHWDVQLKATDSSSYVSEWIIEHPNGEILVTNELANKMELESSGINNDEITVKVEDFVDNLINNNNLNSLSSYFPVLAISSIAIIVWELWKRYKTGQITYSQFKLFSGMAIGQKTIKLGILITLLSIPGINIVVGATMLAQLIYSSREYMANNLEKVYVDTPKQLTCDMKI